MTLDEMIIWLVGDSASISDPGFLARCFLVLCAIFIFTSIAHDVISIGKR